MRNNLKMYMFGGYCYIDEVNLGKLKNQKSKDNSCILRMVIWENIKS